MTSLSTTVGTVALHSAVMTASGTAGYGDELSGYGDLRELGAVVVKSLAVFAFDGNPAPRLAASGEHMVNAVGLSGPGVSAWREQYLPSLERRKATVVGSIWGRTVDEFAEAAEAMHGASIVALEVNASCPNLESRREMFAHSPQATADIVAASRAVGVPLWVKLSPNTPALVEVASAALEAGAESLVLVNTLLGLVVDVEARRPTLANVGGGVSGPGILPVSLRAVYECREAFPDVGIVGVGGVSSGEDAVALLMAGANAVEVGTATFADPRAPWIIQRELEAWMATHGVASIEALIGAAHG
ncbi:MAG TPA: dihydroorotate dehydrogenase [Acidimicrobiales bacterium]|jgi:dihydroorotate dehydrogenase (NAD+) catalytic subunit|nr:dihydroorotate dehydrogenase [Acidimicrobiales bacterium]